GGNRALRKARCGSQDKSREEIEEPDSHGSLNTSPVRVPAKAKSTLPQNEVLHKAALAFAPPRVALIAEVRIGPFLRRRRPQNRRLLCFRKRLKNRPSCRGSCRVRLRNRKAWQPVATSQKGGPSRPSDVTDRSQHLLGPDRRLS